MNPFEIAVDDSHLGYNSNIVGFSWFVINIEIMQILIIKNWTFNLASVCGMDGVHH